MCQVELQSGSAPLGVWDTGVDVTVKLKCDSLFFTCDFNTNLMCSNVQGAGRLGFALGS